MCFGCGMGGALYSKSMQNLNSNIGLLDLDRYLSSISYPGRGILIGQPSNEHKAVIAYFIMGRSQNSRNRILVPDKNEIIIKAFDESKVTDPSLIFYSPIRIMGNKIIVGNGDHTDSVYKYMDLQYTFEQALASRQFEPDAPHYTPRITGIVHCSNSKMNYSLSIIKSASGNPSSCLQHTFSYYNPLPGEGSIIHTYMNDGNPLQSFQGEPKRVYIGSYGIDTIADKIWNSLNSDYKVSLFVGYIHLETLKMESKIINENTQI